MNLNMLEMVGLLLVAGVCGGGLLLWLNLRAARLKTGSQSHHGRRRRRRKRRSSGQEHD